MIQKWVLASYFYSCDIGRILPWLFAFLVMGGFVILYNYIGFRLLAPPFNLSQTAVGAIFIVYLVGSTHPRRVLACLKFRFVR